VADEVQIGRGTVLEGTLKASGTIRIDGRFSGTISNADTVLLAESSNVSGEIRAGSVIVDGQFQGDVKARQSVELHKPCRAKCNVETPSLAIEPGALFEGSCKMGQAEGGERPKANR
jgi:cytoskeletal protein CcmA (bactofilin family)